MRRNRENVVTGASKPCMLLWWRTMNAECVVETPKQRRRLEEVEKVCTI